MSLRSASKYVVLAIISLSLPTPTYAMSVGQIRDLIKDEARGTSVPTSLALAVVKIESNFRTDHEGTDGARGLMQISPATAESLGLDPQSLWQARPNIRAGLSILDGVLKRTDGRWEEAIQIYGTHRHQPQSIANQRYVTAVLKSERQFAEQLAAVDSLSDRRRDGLAGHDDWGSSPRNSAKVAQAGPMSAAPYRRRPEDRAQRREYGPAQGVNAPADIVVYRGNRGNDVEIVIYERDVPPQDRWQPTGRPEYQERDWRPPPPRHRHPRLQRSRDLRLARRFARPFGPRHHHQRRPRR